MLTPIGWERTASVGSPVLGDQARGARPAIGPAEPVWISLAPRRFAAKTTFLGSWISLDFLGFSRPNRAFSTGYTGFSLENFSSRFFPLRGAAWAHKVEVQG